MGDQAQPSRVSNYYDLFFSTLQVFVVGGRMPYVKKRTVGAFIDLERMISFPVNCRVSHSECWERMLPNALDNRIVLVSCFHWYIPIMFIGRST